jgi:hypothetical protein
MVIHTSDVSNRDGRLEDMKKAFDLLQFERAFLFLETMMSFDNPEKYENIFEGVLAPAITPFTIPWYEVCFV